MNSTAKLSPKTVDRMLEAAARHDRRAADTNRPTYVRDGERLRAAELRYAAATRAR